MPLRGRWCSWGSRSRARTTSRWPAGKTGSRRSTRSSICRRGTRSAAIDPGTSSSPRGPAASTRRTPSTAARTKKCRRLRRRRARAGAQAGARARRRLAGECRAVKGRGRDRPHGHRPDGGIHHGNIAAVGVLQCARRVAVPGAAWVDRDAARVDARSAAAMRADLDREARIECLTCRTHACGAAHV